MKFNRELALDDEILELQFWHSAWNSEEFTRRFNRELDEHLDRLDFTLPDSVSVESLTDSKGQLFTARYDIETDASTTFFEAYIVALETAVTELVVQDEGLVDAIDEVYTTTFDELLKARDGEQH